MLWRVIVVIVRQNMEVSRLNIRNLLLFILLSSASWAGEKQSLALEVRMTVSENRGARVQCPVEIGDGRFSHDFFITLQNVGANPLTVIKGVHNDQLVYVSEVGENNQWNHRLIYRWELGEIRDGVLDIPSEADLKLVKLQKGEATQFRIVLYTDEKIERDNVRFEYSLGEKLAARFGTWSGRLEVNLKK